MAPNSLPVKLYSSYSSTISSMPNGSLRVSSTSSVCGKMLRSTKSWLRPSLTASRGRSANIISMASAAAVPSSRSEQLPISMPVSEITAVWKFSSASAW